MREAEIRTVGEHTYELRPLATSAMLRLMARLTKILGPSLGLVENLEQLKDVANIGHLLADLAAHLDEDSVLGVCNVLATHTNIVDGEKRLPLGGGGVGAQWEVHFQGDPVGLFQWLGTALEVNFGPLAAWLAAASKKAKEAAPGPASDAPGK
jgi:hypothetical protein